jgi:hypothetical protein
MAQPSPIHKLLIGLDFVAGFLFNGRLLTMTFAEMLIAANQSNAQVDRNTGQRTPAAVETWRSAESEMAQLLDAAFALELRLGRKVTAADEERVCDMRAELDAATAAMKAKQESSSAI